MNELKPKKVRKIRNGLGIAGAVIAWLGALTEGPTAVMILGVLLLLASTAFHLIFYRCPYCGAHLDRSTGEYCPHCGRKMEED